MGSKVIYSFLIFVPIAMLLEFSDVGGHQAVFVASAIAMIPLAAVLGKATEEAAIYTGPKIGALLNATLGNAAELIIAFAALRAGLPEIVKASIAGSIIGNVLVVLGLALFLGGLKNGIQKFDARAAGVNATMLLLAVVAIAIPGLFALGGGDAGSIPDTDLDLLSDGVAVVMIVVYIAYLLFSLRQTSPGEREQEHESHVASMSLRRALGLMAIATLAVVVMSEILVGALEPTAEAWGMTELFVGVMLVPLVGNIAEHLVAVQVAIDDKMDLSLGIAIGSGLQVALFVMPMLVFLGEIINKPLTLVFNSYELIALVGAGLIAVFISIDGESNWLEGAQLIAAYLIIGTAFFFVV